MGSSESCASGEAWSVGVSGGWGHGPPTSDGMPSAWLRRPAGILCEAHGLTAAAALNGRRGVVVDSVKGGRKVVDFGEPYGQKSVKEFNLRTLSSEEGTPEVSVSPSGVVASVDGKLLQRMPLGDLSRVLFCDARDGTEHALFRAFDGRQSMYLQLGAGRGLPHRIEEALLRHRPRVCVEHLRFWHCGGDASFAARLRTASCRYPLRRDGRQVANWRGGRTAEAYALLCMRQVDDGAQRSFNRQPSDCVLGVLACLGWAAGPHSVRADGLEGAKELNLRTCKVIGASRGRLLVCFDPVPGEPEGKPKALLAANLRRRRLDGAWSPAPEWPLWMRGADGAWELAGGSVPSPPPREEAAGGTSDDDASA